MKSCEQYQAQLLEHLYGLLEAEDSLALIEHAGACDACRSALLQADSQRQLLAAAAVTEFPGICFQTPPAAAVAERPARRAVPFRARLPRNVGRWAVAAGIFLAVAAVSLPLAGHLRDYWDSQEAVAAADRKRNEVLREERQAIDDHDAALARAQAFKKAAETRREVLEREQEKELGALADQLAKQQLYLVVTGHQALRPGVPNEYRIETRNMKNEPENVRLDVRIRDLDTNAIVHKEENVPSDGTYTVSVSPDLSIKAGSQLALEVVARSEKGQSGEIKEKLSLARSVYVTQLATDRPVYRPGETVRFRSVTLDRFSLKPAGDDFRLIYSLLNPQGQPLALTDEHGQPVFSPEQNNQLVREPRVILKEAEGAANLAARAPATSKGAAAPDPKQPLLRGIGAGSFQLPKSLNGGEYTLQVEEADHKFPTEKRKFIVLKYQAPTLRKELNFDKASYGAGDEVTATFKVERAEGGTPLVGQRVVCTVYIDGKYYKADGSAAANIKEAEQVVQTDALGEGSVRFRLPANIERGDAMLSATFTDGAVQEALPRPIRVAVKKLNIEFFPEGGDLVAGVPNRVYFQARTLLDRPAEIKGRILDAAGKKVAEVETVNDKNPGINQGMGEFTFQPEAGLRYRLVLQEPEGIVGDFVLPEAKKDGVVLSVPTGVTTDDKPMVVRLQSVGRDRELLVGAYCRSVLLAQDTVTAKAGEAVELKLAPRGGIGGVYRVTVFEKLPPNANEPLKLKPVAERLVYHQPAKRLNLTVVGKPEYMPGERATLTIKASTETGQPLPTVLLVGIVDKNILTMADERTARSLPTHFLLTSEVRRAEDLEFADVLLSDHAKAAQALDLLLGTQGWRRFLESDPERFKQQQDPRFKADVQRLLVATGKMNLEAGKEQQVIDSIEQKKGQILTAFREKFEELEGQLAGADAALAAAQDRKVFDQRRGDLQKQAAKASTAYHSAIEQLRGFEQRNEVLRERALLGFGVLLLLVGAGSLAVGVVRQLQKTVPIYAVALGAVGLCSLVVVGTYLFETHPETPDEAVAWSATPKPAPTADRNALLPDEPLPGMEDKDGAPVQNKKADPKAAAPQPVPAAKEPHAPPAPPGQAAPRPNMDKPTAGERGDRKGDEGKAEQRNRDKDRDQLPFGLANAGPGKQAGLGRKELEEAAKAGEVRKDTAGRGGALQDRLRERDDQLNQPPVDAMPLNRAREMQQNALEKGTALKKIDGLRQMTGQEEQLQQKRGEQARRLALMAAAEPSLVREYAHVHPKADGGDTRSDFAETLYWHPALVLANGEAKIDFDLCDSVTTFQVLAAGHTADGRLGSVQTTIRSSKPFSLAAKVPTEVTANDTIAVPVTVHNDSAEPRDVQVSLFLTHLQAVAGTDSTLTRTLRLAANQKTSLVFHVQPAIREGPASLLVRGSTQPFGSDSIVYHLAVVPEGFPVNGAKSEMLEKGGAEHTFDLPKEWVKDTLKVELNIYPSQLADLHKGLAGLLREPNGCFEQSSSSNYPNLLVLNYLKATGQDDPRAEKEARDLLARGYARLTSFECRKPGGELREGYEWFGGEAPPHEALTAYGLMQFQDMARVGYPVDKGMIERTRKYLLSCRDGKGGFVRNARAIDTFGRAPQEITDAYIVWALTEADKDAPVKENLDRELKALAEAAKTAKDPYFLALVANSLLTRGRNADGVLQALVKAQKPEGYLDGAQTSITSSGGRDLQIETTALAVLAWLKAPLPNEYPPALNAAIKWISQQRSGHGGFGSTQSTILALKALVAAIRGKPTAVEPGTITLTVNGKTLDPVPLAAGQRDTLTIPVPAADLHAGANTIEIRSTSKTVLPYTLAWSYNALSLHSGAEPPVRLSTKFDRTKAQAGETVFMNIEVRNTTDQAQGMVTAVIGLPAGLALPGNLEQLTDFARLRNDGKDPGKISFWELRGRELVLYWRAMKAKETVTLDLALDCRVPGDYRGPASRAYLYYNADNKHWIDPVRIEVTPKAE